MSWYECTSCWRKFQRPQRHFREERGKEVECHGEFKELARKVQQRPTVQQAANRIYTDLLRINVMLAGGVVENLDQVKQETARGIHEALQHTVEIWTKKAPDDAQKLRKRL